MDLGEPLKTYYMIKIQILKDTPFDVKGTELSLSDFRLKYGYICSRYISDIDLVRYIEEWESHPVLSQTCDYCISDWFKVIRTREPFVIGDWVWHEKLQKAFYVVNHCDGKLFWPNFVTVEAANEFVDIYKRLAKQSEIDDYKLIPYCGGTILIGRLYFYYFDNVWKHISGVTFNINKYLRAFKEYENSFVRIGVIKGESLNTEIEYPVRFGGLQIGCKNIPHPEIIEIAKQLNLL